MKPRGGGRVILIVLIGLAIWAAALTLCPLAGAESVDAGKAFSDYFSGIASPEASILFQQRIPRVLLALLAGGALALAGVAFQALLSNPLASPYTLGIASGSALGAVAAINLGLAGASVALRFSVMQVASLAGAGAVTLAIYLMSRRKGRFSMMGLLLAGVTLGLISASLILFVRYISRPGEVVVMDRWMMGGLSAVGYGEVLSLLPFVVVGGGVLFLSAGALNQLAFGEELASGRGVDVQALQKRCFASASLATAGVVAVTGPIGFVGLIVPHAVRRILGPDHLTLMPMAFFAGGAFLAVCDLAGRVVMQSMELPVGIVTAMLGGPFFLLLIAGGRER